MANPSPPPPENPPPREGLLDELVDLAIEAEIETAHEATKAEAERGLLRRGARVVAGAVLVIVGLLLIVLPGPGLLVIAMGLGLMARDVPFARRWLRLVRARIPADDEGEVAVWVVAASAGLVVLSLGATLWWTVLR